MADYKPVTLTFHSKGLDIRAASDEVALDQFAVFQNMTSDREGAIRTRLGRTALNSTPISGTDMHTLAKIYTPVPYRYAGVDDKLHRAAGPFSSYSQVLPGAANQRNTDYKVGDLVVPTTPNGHCYICATAGTTGGVEPTWPTLTSKQVTDGTCVWQENNFSGAPMLTAAYAPGSSTKPYMYFANANMMVKDSGTGSPVLWGIIGPPAAPTVAINAPAEVLVEAFQDPNPQNYWTRTDPGGILGLNRDGSVFIGPNGSFSLRNALSTAGIASITVNNSFDLSSFGAIPASDQDHINLYVRADVPSNLSEMLLQFSIGDANFTEYYEKAIGPASTTAGTNWSTNTHSATVSGAVTTAADVNIASSSDSTTPYVSIAQDFLPATISPTGNVWTQLQIPRDQFTKNAATTSTNSWANVMAVRFRFNVLGPINIWLDDMEMDGGSGLAGSNYQWVVRYRNSSTNEHSGISALSSVATQIPVQQSATLTVASSQDPQVTNVDFYRIGGTVTSLAFVGTVANDTSASTVTFVDGVADIDVGDGILTADQTTNLRPPNSIGVEFHLDRLWTWGGAGDAPNVLRYSEKVDVEHFPSTNYIYVGDASESIIRVVSFDDETLYAFTLNDVYRVIGTDETSFVAMRTSYGRGMVNNPFAMTVSPSRIFHQHYDGIYEFPSGKKMSQPIDGVFHGQTINSISPLNTTAVSRVRMGFADNKLYVFYPSGSSFVNDASMVFDGLYERWNQSGVTGRSLFFEKDTSILTMGPSDGYVYQMETGTTDSGAAIPFAINTGYLHLGYPDQDKRWGDLALDIDTNGQNVTVQLLFDNGTTTDTAQVVSCTGRRQLQIPINGGDSMLALNARLTITGTVTQPVVIWKAIYRIIVEPPRRRTFVTDWDDDASPGRKQYRTIMLDVDTLGNSINVALELDGQSSATQTFQNVSTTGRKVIFLAPSVDTVGTKSRLKFSQANDSTTAVFKLYAYKIETIPQPDNPTVWQTDWTDSGYVYDKYWKEVLLEIDTSGVTQQCQFWLDNAVVQTFPVTANGRRRLTISLNQDLVGKLGRITFPGSGSNQISLWNVKYVTEQEPPDVTFADSYSQTFGHDRYKFVKRMWLALKATAPVTYTFYADSVIRATGTLTVVNPPSGWQKIEVPLPATIKGKLIQLVLASDSAFKIYWTDSEVEWRPINSERSYQRYKFDPPQLN